MFVRNWASEDQGWPLPPIGLMTASLWTGPRLVQRPGSSSASSAMMWRCTALDRASCRSSASYLLLEHSDRQRSLPSARQKLARPLDQSMVPSIWRAFGRLYWIVKRNGSRARLRLPPADPHLASPTLDLQLEGFTSHQRGLNICFKSTY